MTVKIIRVDPYHKVYGMLVPNLAQRLLEALQALGDDEGIMVARFMSALWAKSPNELLLAALDEKGFVKGFCAANIVENECFMVQPRMDVPTDNDAVKEMVDTISNWAKDRGCNWLTLTGKRSDPKWLKRFDFSITRYVMQRELV